MPQSQKEILLNFKQHLEKDDKSKNTIRGYVSDVKIFLFEMLDTKDLSYLDKSIIKIYTDKFFSEDSPYKSASLQKKKHSWNAFCKYIEKSEWKIRKRISKSYVFQSNPLKEEDFENMIFCIKQRLRKSSLIKTIMLLRQKVFLICGRNLGLRASEFRHLSFEDIMKKEIVTIKNSKAGNHRTIPITESVKKVVTELHSFLTKNNIFFSDFIFQKGNGKFISTRTLQRWIKQLANNANIPAEVVYTHALRHAFATNFIEQNGEQLIHLGNVMGHRSVETTRRYTKPSHSHMKAMMEKSSFKNAA